MKYLESRGLGCCALTGTTLLRSACEAEERAGDRLLLGKTNLSELASGSLSPSPRPGENTNRRSRTPLCVMYGLLREARRKTRTENSQTEKCWLTQETASTFLYTAGSPPYPLADGRSASPVGRCMVLWVDWRSPVRAAY